MSDRISLMLDAAGCAAAATASMIEAARDPDGCFCADEDEGLTILALADALRLLIKATEPRHPGHRVNHLHGVLVDFLEDQA